MLEKTRKHLRENKKVYIAGAIGVAAGAVAVLLLAKDGSPLVRNSNENKALLIWKPKQTIEVFIEALGDPGNIIQDTTTGTIYASQNQAAIALGVYPARISEHISGKLPDIKGHVLEKIGKAPVSQ